MAAVAPTMSARSFIPSWCVYASETCDSVRTHTNAGTERESRSDSRRGGRGGGVLITPSLPRAGMCERPASIIRVDLTDPISLDAPRIDMQLPEAMCKAIEKKMKRAPASAVERQAGAPHIYITRTHHTRTRIHVERSSAMQQGPVCSWLTTSTRQLNSVGVRA